MDIFERIKRLRKSLHVTQEEVGFSGTITQQHLSRIEKGIHPDTSYRVLSEILELYGYRFVIAVEDREQGDG